MFSERADLVNIPNGLTVKREHVMRVDFVLHHADNTMEHTLDGDMVNTAPPLAFLNVCEVYVRVTRDGEVWVPTMADLSDAGKMLIAMLMDAYPGHGKSQLRPTAREIESVMERSAPEPPPATSMIQ